MSYRSDAIDGIIWIILTTCCRCTLFMTLLNENNITNNKYSKVVHRSIPTSNRNSAASCVQLPRLYIVLFLHQTATLLHWLVQWKCCISFYSYIKPQLRRESLLSDRRCISFYSYIKPQPLARNHRFSSVVYRSIPTSNRNIRRSVETTSTLYIVLFLHQTATALCDGGLKLGCISFYSYIKPQLRLERSALAQSCISFYSYIKPQLLQSGRHKRRRCISFYSYIKPQLWVRRTEYSACCISFYSYIKPQLHSQATSENILLYIVLFLHQTATFLMS